MMKDTRGWGAAAVLLTSMALSLAAQAPPPQPPPQGRGGAQGAGQGGAQGAGQRGGPPPGRGGGFFGGGPSDLPTVEPAAADRGRTVYTAQCVSCHGEQARGTGKGANLVRSVVVNKDRYGTELGPFLLKGHPVQSGTASALTEAQIKDLSHFLRQRINDSMRGSPIFKAGNVLTGDAKAGAEFFNGAGKCASCHPPSGSLNGIGTRFEPVDLQQRFLFPRSGGRGRGAAAATAAVTVTVTPPTGPALSGVLVQMDDFNVSLRDSAGAYHSLKRTPGLKIVKTDPLAAHIALLDTITDKQMHDVVAYLETLK